MKRLEQVFRLAEPFRDLGGGLLLVERKLRVAVEVDIEVPEIRRQGLGSRSRRPGDGAEQGEESDRGHDGKARHRISAGR